MRFGWYAARPSLRSVKRETQAGIRFSPGDKDAEELPSAQDNDTNEH